MKRISTLVMSLLLAGFVQAKKVKFSVNMDTLTINTTGVHVFGDFQAVAGYAGGDWQSNTTPLAQEGTSSIYSVIVDIPAFAKYEYKFLNGDQSYEVEFVPDPSRVGYNFDDNRWIYVDSLADDTTDVGAVLFSGNAPSGLTLMRFLVDMQYVLLSTSGIHVAGNFQGWDPIKTRMYSFGASVYEIIAYATAGTYEYKYYNGSALSDSEAVPSSCMVNFNRELQVLNDTVLPAVCYSSCVACPTGIAEHVPDAAIKLFPNPAGEYAVLELAQTNSSHSVFIRDIAGRRVRTYENHYGQSLRIERGTLEAGLYFISVHTSRGFSDDIKLVIR